MVRIRTAGILAAQVIWFAFPLAGQDDPARIWTDQSGRELKARFLYFEEGQVGLKLPSGREAAIGLETLSRADQDYVFKISVPDVFEFPPTEMPHQVKVEDADVSISGGPTIFETKWFRFETEETLSRNFVQEAAQIFEATREAVFALPLGLKSHPPAGLDKFTARFVTKDNFQSFLKNSPRIDEPNRIAGVYDPKLKSIYLPYDQLGARRKNGHMTLLKTSDTSTLIHEITHQVMHDHLPLAPIWFSEGFAEYMASIPYEDGVFDFQKSVAGLKTRLRTRYGTLRVKLPPLQELLDMQQADWQGRNQDYTSALLFTYYFMHLDQSQAPGSPLAAYLFLLGQAKKDTNRLIADYNDAVHSYNGAVVKYNAAIAEYRNLVTVYQSQVRQYNQRVDRYNAQLSEGVPNSLLIELGAKPAPPVLPVEPRMPAILRNSRIDAPLNLFRIANNRARPALLRARDYEALQREITEKFRAVGIEVSFP